MHNATAIVHVSPAAGAAFTQYTAELEEGGHLGEALGQRFVYVLEGELEVGHLSLSADKFAYLPEGAEVVVRSRRRARVTVIEKEYQQLSGIESPGRGGQAMSAIYRLRLCVFPDSSPGAASR